MLEDVWSIIQAEIPFTKKYAQASKVCLLGVVNHTQRRTTSHSGLGIVAEVKMNQSQAVRDVLSATLISTLYL